nr:sperm acrosome-associated protein 7 [Odocoileus virginianus texanus]
MAATTGVTLLVLLLCCGQGAELPPINLTSASSTETPANLSNLDDDMATIFGVTSRGHRLPHGSSHGGQRVLCVKQRPRLRFQSAVWVRASLHHAFSYSFHAPPQDASIDESNQLSAGEGFHEFADVSPISLEAEDKILNEPGVDASHHTSGPGGYHDAQISSGTADSLHSNGKKHPKTDQQLKQSVLDMILQNIGKSSGNSLQ